MQSLQFGREQSQQSDWAGWPWAVGEALGGLAAIAVRHGDLMPAESLLRERLALARVNGATPVVAHALLALASALRLQGRGSESQSLYQEGLALARTIPDPSAIGSALQNLACLEMEAGNPGAAAVHLREAIAVCRGMSDPGPGLRCLEAGARWAQVAGQTARAAQLFGALDARRDPACSSWPAVDAGAPAAPSTRAEEAAALGSVRAALGEPAFAAAQAEGRAMGLPAALSEALQSLGGF